MKEGLLNAIEEISHSFRNYLHRRLTTKDTIEMLHTSFGIEC